MNDRPHYPWNQGDELFAEELNAAIANSGAYGPFVPIHANSPANVMDFGADPTGVMDSTAAIRAAIATGKNVYLPAGEYRVSGRLLFGGDVTKSQSVQGDALGTTLLIDAGFDPTVTDGVLVFGWDPSSHITNQSDQRPCISNINFKFAQPADIVSVTTAASLATTNTITVADATGIIVGMAVFDSTSAAAIPSVPLGSSSVATTVTNIAGNVITLSTAIAAPGVGLGDSIHFASTRSMFKTLAAGGTATQGGTGIRYPWAISCINSQTILIDNVMIIGAWDGVYIRGSSFQVGRLNVMAFDVGLDIDACGNFPAVTDYRFWPWGYASSDQYGKDRAALLTNVYYDGVTVAANFGRTDGMAADNIQSWVGIVNLTATWTWGSFLNLFLDGTNSNLNVLSTSGSGWVQIGSFYSTKGQRTIGDAISINPTHATFLVIINNIVLSSGSTFYRGITQLNGRVSINGGYIWDGLGAARSMINVSAGTMQLSNIQLDASTARSDSYIHVLGGATGFEISDCVFLAAPTPGAVGIVLDVDTALMSIRDVTWNGWLLTLPSAVLAGTSLGDYQKSSAGSWQYFGDIAVGHTAAISGAAGNQRNLYLQTSGSTRWAVQASGSAESGGNAGSNFNIFRYDDTGAQISTPPISILRSSGVVLLPNLAIGTSLVTSPTVLSGAGAASGTQPKGSIWMRTDGGVGTTLYVSQGAGTWNPVAGV